METQEDICSIQPCNANTVIANLKERFRHHFIYVSESFLFGFDGV